MQKKRDQSFGKQDFLETPVFRRRRNISGG
jgi:hypothetical protein